ncbi:MAG TPA: hypothetical protein VF188_18960 [Longimicrobiales bacterium]
MTTLKRFAISSLLSMGLLGFSGLLQRSRAVAAADCHVEVGVECDVSGCKAVAKLVCDF